MLNRLVVIVILVPVAIILIALAVANRTPVAFTLDPFNPGNPGLTAEMPLFVYLFLAIALGMIIGSIATWLRQGRYRKVARQRRDDAGSIHDPATGKQTALPRPRA
ncbi:putative integral membrane protein [Mesorhizobium sp. J18]|uniref:LapA family protein n=1 Tax=Mesorhizobium sp. J18 TaxID=935263 RepID=UPI00119AA9A4|nr:LapA family protein [Mesorhizobium sp. J18]TWG91316.1 putative integral membrane protein [Mesorhizobium sp. J18]